MLKITAMGSTHAEYFPHKKHKRACKRSIPPYNSYHTPRVMLYFFFLEKTCWLLSEPAITRHKSGHPGDVLIITADIYRMFIVYLELY